MKDKAYEMYDEYNQAVEDLLGFIKIRDDLAASIKTGAPEKLREAQELLIEMDEAIESCESKLAKEYEAYQTKCRAEEELDNWSADVEKRIEMVFIYIKHRIPEKLDELKNALFANWTPDEIEKFYANVAVLEATQLEEIIAENQSE
jgi:hypothetical protein